MDRRRFIQIGCAIAATGKVRLSSAAAPKTVALFWVGSAASQRHVAVIREALREQGFPEPAAIRLDTSSMVDRYEALELAVPRLIEQRPHVIVTYGGTSATALKGRTAIPVVLVSGADPVKAGFASSLARPGGNMTGVWTVSTESTGKRIEVLRRIAPRVERVGYLYNDQSATEVSGIPLVTNDARKVGFILEPQPVRVAADIGPAVMARARAGVGAFLAAPSTMLTANAPAVVAAISNAKLPAVYANTDFAEAGGLAAYGPNVAGGFRLAARYVARILRGDRPSDMPVEQYSQFELVLNAKTARAQGIELPQSLLGLADRVIEA